MRIALVAALLLTFCCSVFAGDRVTVHVMGLFHPQELTVSAEPDHLLTATVGDRELTVGDALCRHAILMRAGQRVSLQCGALRFTSKEITFSLHGGDAALLLAVPGKLQRDYRGQLKIASDGAELVAVVEMDIETAVASIVAAELPGDTPLEALKAQAIVARSFLVASRHRHLEAEFCDTTHCQFLRNPPPASSAPARAALATKGLVLTWNGKPFPAMYSASCGGHTRTLAQTGYRQHDYPYFSVECAYCKRHPDRGSSPGHGIGLCQKGSAAMAKEGADFHAILAHYFPNTGISTR